MVDLIPSSGINSKTGINAPLTPSVTINSPVKLAAVLLRVLVSITGTVPTTVVDTVQSAISTIVISGPKKSTNSDANSLAALAAVAKVLNISLPYSFTNPKISASATAFEADIILPFEDLGLIKVALTTNILSAAFSDMAPTAAEVLLDAVGIPLATNKMSRSFKGRYYVSQNEYSTKEALALGVFSSGTSVASIWTQGNYSLGQVSQASAVSMQLAADLLSTTSYLVMLQNVTAGPISISLSGSGVSFVEVF